MNKISAVIITFNEEENIARCLESVVGVVDEIVVVDSFSTDSTKKICESKGVRFIERSFEGYVNQKNIAAEAAAFDYISAYKVPEMADKWFKSVKDPSKNLN